MTDIATGIVNRELDTLKRAFVGKHHCRSCGKIYCASCLNKLAKLQDGYFDYHYG